MISRFTALFLLTMIVWFGIFGRLMTPNRKWTDRCLKLLRENWELAMRQDRS